MARTMFAVAHVTAPDVAEAVAAEVRERWAPETLYVVDASPVLGAHAGPGATAAAVP